MMQDVYILNEDLQMIGIVDAYKSLIWAKRYRDLGDCELYVRATAEALGMLKIGRYIVRDDDDMVCRIKKITLTTSAEDGNYLSVVGTDAKSYLDQRIIWGTETLNGSVETFVRSLVTSTLINPALTSRKLVNSQSQGILSLGTAASLPETASEQVSYANVGEKVREYCLRYGWGYKMTWESGGLVFYLYKGEDKTDSVIFSDEFENLSSTSYEENHESAGNVALVAGMGEGDARSRTTVGYNAGTERYEVYVDADDIAQEITFEALLEIYPLTTSGGTGSIVTTSDGYAYQLSSADFEIFDQNQKASLLADYPTGSVVTVSGKEYFRISNVNVAELTSAAPEQYDSVRLLPIVYMGYLTSRGKEKLSEYGAYTTFNGSVIPNITFIYKTDYNLGDLVTVRNEYGITKEARIVEVIEVNDDSGYSIEPKFEYLVSGAQEAAAPSGQTISYAPGATSVTEYKADQGGGSGALANLMQATGSGTSATSIAASTMTKVPLVASGAITLGSGFEISDGGIKVTNAGYYRISGGVYMGATLDGGAISKDIYVWRGATYATASEVMSTTDDCYTGNQSGAVGTVSFSSKVIQASANDIFFLVCRVRNGTGSYYAENNGTFLLVEHLTPGTPDPVTVTQDADGDLWIS